MFGSKFKDFGILTTPQLHHIVRSINDSTYGEPTEPGYFVKLTKSFNKLTVKLQSSTLNSQAGRKCDTLLVDCANGVGALKMMNLFPWIKCVNTNTTNHQLLNHDVFYPLFIAVNDPILASSAGRITWRWTSDSPPTFLWTKVVPSARQSTAMLTEWFTSIRTKVSGLAHFLWLFNDFDLIVSRRAVSSLGWRQIGSSHCWIYLSAHSTHSRFARCWSEFGCGADGVCQWRVYGLL